MGAVPSLRLLLVPAALLAAACDDSSNPIAPEEPPVAEAEAPKPITDAQASRLPSAAVAGMTMPVVLRRSPPSRSVLTSTRSCSIWIGRLPPAGAVMGELPSVRQ